MTHLRVLQISGISRFVRRISWVKKFIRVIKNSSKLFPNVHNEREIPEFRAMEFHLFSPFHHRKISSSVFFSLPQIPVGFYLINMSYLIAKLTFFYKCNAFAFFKQNLKVAGENSWECRCYHLYDIKCYWAMFKVLIIFLVVCSHFCVNMVTKRKNLATFVCDEKLSSWWFKEKYMLNMKLVCTQIGDYKQQSLMNLSLRFKAVYECQARIAFFFSWPSPNVQITSEFPQWCNSFMLTLSWIAFLFDNDW